MAALPLTIRKAIRDNEPKLQQHLATINAATGKEFVVEVDWAKNVEQIEPSSKDRIGEIYYNQALSALAKNIEKLTKNETAKEAFNEATSANKIVINIDDKSSEYWVVSFSNGELVVSHKKSIANISNLEYFNIINVLPTPGIPLFSKLNLEQFQPKLEENLAIIAQATGVSDWVFEADFVGTVPQLDASSQRNIGGLYYDQMMGALARNFKKAFQNEILKEAFVEAASERKIEIRLDDKIKDYHDISFKNGVVILSHKKSIVNLSNIEYIDLASRIPVPGIPLVTKVNLAKADNQQALQDSLAKISSATGVEDWSLEVDFATVLPNLDKSSQDRIGDIYYSSAMKYLASMLEKKLKIDTVKEAFNEATQNHKIIINVNDKAKEYWDVKIQDNNLVLEHKKSIANVSNLEYYSIENVIPVPGLPLVVKLNFQNSKNIVDEALERIAKSTGAGEWTFECDYETLIPQLQPSEHLRAGQTIADAIKNFANLLDKKLKNPLVQEAFNEATAGRRISMKVNEKQNSYWNLSIQDGGVVITSKKSYANLNEIDYYALETIIPVPGVLSLVSKINLEDNRPKLEESLQKIATATGAEYTFDDSCFATFYPKLSESERNRIGSIFYNDVMAYLERNLTKCLKDEMTKEAFNEVSTTHQISFEHAPAIQSGYWKIAFVNGSMVVSFKQIVNINEVEQFKIEKLL